MLAYTYVYACVCGHVRGRTHTHAPKNIVPERKKQERKVYKERNK